MARSTTGESVIERTVRIFDAFGPGLTVLTLSQIARKADLPLSTAARMVEQLVGFGLLQRDDRNQVQIGLRLWELGLRASPTLSLKEAAMPFMEMLHACVKHHTQLGVLDGDTVIFVERLTAVHAVVNFTPIGGRLPLNVSSAGLVLLAHAPADFQERILTGPLTRLSPHTITDPRELRTFLAEIRRDGFSHCPGFVHVDAAGLAAPVRDGHGRVVAALSIVVPNDASARGYLPVLRAAAAGIGQAIGSATAGD